MSTTDSLNEVTTANAVELPRVSVNDATAQRDNVTITDNGSESGRLCGPSDLECVIPDAMKRGAGCHYL